MLKKNLNTPLALYQTLLANKPLLSMKTPKPKLLKFLFMIVLEKLYLKLKPNQ